jgi:protein TonB
MRSLAVATVVLSLLVGWPSPSSAQQTLSTTPPVFDGPGVAHPGDVGLTPPKALKQVKTQYTADALRAKIQGVVTLECVVKSDGKVGEVRVVKSLDKIHGLDDEAIKAAKQWRFSPGLKHGKAVPVVISLEFTFTRRQP